MSRGRPLEIAIVGMGCRFPGARDLCAYWANILAGRDCTREVPPDRWEAATFVDPSSLANDRLPGARGGYLDSPIVFDAAEHGIMPRTIAGGEPEQFLVLDTAMAALADAGLAPGDLSGRRVEVVVGRGNYFNRGSLTRLQHGRIVAQTTATLAALHPEWSRADLEAVRVELKAGLPPFEAATIAGQLTNATAGRIAHRLDLSGAAYIVDAASASALVALDLAGRALVRRRADLAIVGAVYLEADVDFPLVFHQLGALSRSGTARPFAADADGLLSGEGAGVLVLKRRDDADRDGDRIYAVVQGLGLSSDGRGRGLAAPSARGHARAIRRAYRRSGIDPATVMLVEGHGLGVPAADRAELRALHAVFPPPRHGRRTLGAVSSMIGHAMPAAGMAGLIKAALALFHRALPPTLHAEAPHRLLDTGRGAFTLPATARPWIHPDPQTPRRAGVNSFGFAGINAHAVLEEHAASADGEAPGALRRWETEAMLLAAPDRPGLVERARALIDWLARHPGPSLADIAFTLNCAGTHPPAHAPGGARLGLVASSPSDLAQRLAAVLPRLRDPACRALRDGRGAYYWDEPLGDAGAGRLAFLFPGEGSQYPGMLADLCFHFPEIRRLFDTSDRIALELGQAMPPSEHLFGNPAAADPRLWSAPTAVNVVLSSQWALYQVLTQLGLRPDAVAGHSSGELLALAAAGVLEADEELERQLGRLGAIFSRLEEAGDVPTARLVAVAAGRRRVEATCRGLGSEAGDVIVAIDNCPHQVVLAGPPAGVERVVLRLRAEDVLCEDLPFARAYHTPGFAAVLGPVAEFFARLALRTPQLPIYSCAVGGRMPDRPEAIRELAVAQWTRPVAFRQTVEAMHADGLRLFVDVGARGNLAGFVEDTLRGRSAFAIAANLPRRSGLTQLNHLVAALFAQGVPVRTDFLYRRRQPRALDWDAPEPTPRPVVQLEIGFPAMRLSDSLIARLRSQGSPGGSPAQAARPETPLGPVDPNPSGWGLSPQGDAPRATGEHASATALDQPAMACPSPEGDGAMLAFHRTMRAFLQTQQEVLAAYLSDPEPGYPGNGALSGGNGSLRAEWSAPSVSSSTPAESCAATTSGPEPGPWVTEVRRLVVGSGIEAVSLLDGRDDPIAAHHTLGGGRVSALDTTLKGLPVLPFAVMAEMAAQAAALIVSPGLMLTGLAQVRAHKWVRYEAVPVHLELRGHRVASGDDERAWMGLFNRGTDGRAEALRPVFEAVAIFAGSVPAPTPATPWALAESQPSRFTAESLYDEQWLFHGPPLRALVRVGRSSPGGAEGGLRVMPWEPLLRPGLPPRLHTDPIVIDSFTHLLGCWGLDQLAEGGDVVFPLRLEELRIHGERPPVGTDVECRITTREILRHRVRVEAEIVRPDGTVWMRLTDWEDWRFHWPSRYRDVFRQPRAIFVGEALPLDDPILGAISGAAAVWLAPPADMGRAIWRDVLEQTQLGPAERAAHLAAVAPANERRRAQRLWGRIAAKEAARRLGREAGQPPTYPADLAVVVDHRGRPRLIRVEEPDDGSLPSISIAHADGVSVAIAAREPGARVGIDVERIHDGAEAVEAAAFSPAEQAILARWSGPLRAEWAARLRCAKRAAAKADGIPSAVAEIEQVDEATGMIRIRLAPSDAGIRPIADHGAAGRAAADPTTHPVRVISARRGEFAWAWTLGEGAES
jgi:acyl transferase domain-containing protein/phosphopantetheinyl transferase